MRPQVVSPARAREGPSRAFVTRLFLWALAASWIIFAAVPSRAAKPAPEVSSPDGSPVRTLSLAGARFADLPCTIGETSPPVFSVNYVYPPDDAYYVLITAGTCASCVPPDSTIVSTAHLVLQFPTACSQPVSISIVGTTGGPSCRLPDPTNVLCPPTAVDLAPNVAGTYDFELPIPAPCHLSTDAFLCVNFVQDGVGCATLGTRPRLMTTGRCANCQNYNIYPTGSGDLCALSFPGALVMYVDAVSCAVPTLSRSWGAVKTYYR